MRLSLEPDMHWNASFAFSSPKEVSCICYRACDHSCQLVRPSEYDIWIVRCHPLISTANKWIMDHPVLQIGIYSRVAKDGSEKTADRTLDALCGFDFLYSVCINAIGDGHGGAYPAFALFKDKRIQPVARAILSNDERARRALLPGCSDEDISTAFNAIWRLAARQAMQYSNWIWGTDYSGLLKAFREKYPPRDEEAEV